ncbi:MAG: GAF and ANTAR domain-containing protein [Frankiaceae bacterium]
MLSFDAHHPAVSAVLSTAATLLGMEVVFIGGMTDESFTFHRVHGEWPGVTEGTKVDRTDSFCHRMLEGAAPVTSDAEQDWPYRDAPVRSSLGIRSYVGVPIHDSTGAVIGTLCGIDHGSVPVEDSAIQVLRELAQVVGAHVGPLAGEHVVIHRTPDGWQVAGDEGNDLTSAMVLADLIASELDPGPRPPRPDGELDELAQLRLSVSQLEHALTARVAVEQAIGVLAERQHVAPRVAFERLRKAARSRGRKVHDLAREVIASVNDRSVPLPPELAPRR